MLKTVGILSLSSGIIGEDFIQFEVDIGLRRLGEMGLTVKFLPNARKGLAYLKAHPEKRAEDLLTAFQDPEIDLILCAIGGDDTYRLLPHLFDGDALKNALTPKPFLGYSDTTLNHLMLHKLGLPTFYGQAFLSDVCELGPQMLPYTRHYFEELIATDRISAVRPSDTWYEERTSFSPDQVGTLPTPHPDRGFQLLQGPAQFSGKILGGCIDSLYDMFSPECHPDMPALCQKYQLFPTLEEWKGRILLLESSEEKPAPEKYRRALEFLKEAGVFSAVSGVLVAKPQDEAYAEEYHRQLIQVIDDPALPILCNLNIGHSSPHCILPFGVEAHVDADRQIIRFAH